MCITYIVWQNRHISRKRRKELPLTDSSRGQRQVRGVKSCRSAAASGASALRRNILVFPRRQRLSRAVFPSGLKGKRLISKNLSVLLPQEGVQGYAVVLPKKVARLAVTRHRIKRHILAALRTLSLPPSLIVFPKISVHSVSYEDIRTELKNLLS